MATFPVVQGVEVFMAPPEGYVVDFENPQQHTALVSYILAGVGMVMAMIFFIQYLYVKLWLMQVLDIETVLLILAWVTGVVQNGVLLSSWAIKTLGVHAWEMSLDQYNLFNKLMLVASIHFAVFIACSKLSLVLFYRHLSPQKWWKRCTYAVAVLIICYNTAILFAVVFTCNPIRKHWDARVTEGSCGHQIGIYMTTATMGIVTDLILLIMPIPMIWRLQMPTRQKIGVILLFFIGFGLPDTPSNISLHQPSTIALKMPRVSYTEDKVVEAILDVTDNGLSQNESAQKHEIPRSTLGDRLRGLPSKSEVT
ncbi:hypothetical protein MRS44_016009 [Fusarium solani]|uniref:uncharacterized protein n=1 Tax=Fusarium solani TaxID=169388 RepID=UPI0032C44E5F|nr:hypothetical protein MRS44_016009 [Fusarium solani]